MTVLLTGASGFVGLNIAEALLADGREVVLFSHAALPGRAGRTFASLPGRMTEVIGDVRDRNALDEVFRTHRPTQVVHGAALTPGAATEREQARATVEVNLLGTVMVLEAAAAAGSVGRVVHLGSVAVYGRSGVEVEMIDEDLRRRPEATYAITKLAGELLAVRLAELHGLDLMVCRLGTVFGPWERDTGVRETLSSIFLATKLARAGRPAVLARPCRRDWLYSRDVAGAVMAVLDHPEPPHRIVNVGPGRSWTLAEWCDRLAGRFPAFTHRVAGPGEATTVELWGERDRAPLAIDQLTQGIGYQPRFGLDEAFADYLDWLDDEL
jgi:UDP-glucuronate 4-epimerase